MKRFYKAAVAVPAQGGHEIRLDGRPVKTPARNPQVVPGIVLAEAMAAEWSAQADKVDPRSMPLTGLANAAIDRVTPDPVAFAAGLAQYGESDLLCYRAQGPQALVERQSQVWDPILVWARRRFDVEIETVPGIIHHPQPERTVAQLGRAVAARDPFALAALAPLVTISGSLLIALALAEGAIDFETAWAAAALDEIWQAEQWGEDAEASAALEARRREFAAAYRFLTLL